MEDKNYMFKILIVGDNSTGKTSIVKRYVHNLFSNRSRSTVGINFDIKRLTLEDNVNVKLQLWDVAGQEIFGTMTRVYYRDAVGAFIVFDMTRPETLELASVWKKDIDEKVRLSDGSRIPVVLLGNKYDLAKSIDQDVVLESVQKKDNYLKYFPVSAKDNINIEESMTHLICSILDTIDHNLFSNKSEEPVSGEVVNLNVLMSKSTSSSWLPYGCCVL